MKSHIHTEAEKTRIEPATTRSAVDLNDNVIRWIGIPSFGIVIPNLTGLLDVINWREPGYWFSYIYFVTLSALIWQGNRYLLFRTRQRFTWFDKPIEKLFLLVVNNVFYTAPVTTGMLCLWYSWQGEQTDWKTVQVVTLINIICVLFVTHVYETVFMVKEQQNEQLKTAHLLRAKAETELAVLKNQIDPHFMFNSLNTLSYLIENDPLKALAFTDSLAEVYRYILVQKDSNLVFLEDEVEFTSKYTTLLQLRFGDSLIIENIVNRSVGKDYLIPPTSVFMAFENAVKHNEISEEFPLRVQLTIDGDCLKIRNSIRLKGASPHTSKVGLNNLNDRFRILTGKQILVETNAQEFMIVLPMIHIN